MSVIDENYPGAKNMSFLYAELAISIYTYNLYYPQNHLFWGNAKYLDEFFLRYANSFHQ